MGDRARDAATEERGLAIQAIIDGDRQRAVDAVDRLLRLALAFLEARRALEASRDGAPAGD